MNKNLEGVNRAISRSFNDIKRRIKNKDDKIDVIFLETSCCIGESIVFLNAVNPDAGYFLNEMINLKFSHSLGMNDYTFAQNDFNNAVKDGGYVLIIGGSISLKEGGAFCILGYDNGKDETAADAVLKAAQNAELILNTGTCACFGGVTSAGPNVTGCVTVPEFLKMNGIDKPYINIPGCPTKSEWIVGTITHLMKYGMPNLDDKHRPLMYFGEYIHDHCERRSYFDAGIFATKMGDKECYFKMGCLGPITRANCSRSRWNGTNNWPVANNSPCIGCAYEGFPDKIESFIKEEKDLHGYQKRSKD